MGPYAGVESLPVVPFYRFQHEVAVYYLPPRRPEEGGIGCKVIYDQRPPHIWLTIGAFPQILGSPSSII